MSMVGAKGGRRMRVLVTDGDSRAALAATRALGRRGHSVVVGEKRSRSLAHASRYCDARLVYPDPTVAEAAFLNVLADAVISHHVDVILPIADITTSLVTQHRGLFEPHCRVPFADFSAIARAADKVDIVQTADRLGVPTPRSWIVSVPEDAIDSEVPFPVVLKPHRSRVRTEDGWRCCDVSYARTPQELRDALRKRALHEFPILLQERITGPGLGVFVCYDHGRLMALFSHNRVREKPPWGGVSVLCESTTVCPHAREYTERLMGELNWHGVAMVEFKRDLRDGQPRLMEINGRFWGSLQLSIDAGVDFPNILLDTVQGGDTSSPRAYRVGVKCRWLWGDFDSLLRRLNAGPADWPALDGRGRLASILQFMRFAETDLYYDNPKPDDIVPWLHETWSRLWPSG
jgi:predicted ATP-grasp superfamily ATP-dependent carboligase